MSATIVAKKIDSLKNYRQTSYIDGFFIEQSFRNFKAFFINFYNATTKSTTSPPASKSKFIIDRNTKSLGACTERLESK